MPKRVSFETKKVSIYNLLEHEEHLKESFGSNPVTFEVGFSMDFLFLFLDSFFFWKNIDYLIINFVTYNIRHSKSPKKNRSQKQSLLAS